MLLSDPELTVAQRMAQHALQIFQGELDRELNQEKQAQELRRLLEHAPAWFQPLFQPMRYKAAYGGRAGGKSHSFAEYLIARMVVDPDLSCVCIREIQKSLKYSVKRLIEGKIISMGVSHLFNVQRYEIHRKGGRGVLIFQGMQDHTADSIKSLEGFGIAWVEEAQSISDRSLSLLLPTIRAEGSEVWFTWNPENAEDAVDQMFRGVSGAPADAICVPVNWSDNPFISSVSLADMERDRQRDTDYWLHVWEGGYNIKSALQVYSGKWQVIEVEGGQPGDDGPYYGADWGFGSDPTAAVEVWIRGRQLLITRDSRAYALELDDTAQQWIDDIPGIQNHTIYSDNSRPESISHVRRGRPPGGSDKGCPALPKLQAVDKWPGSVEDGIQFIRAFDQILVHPRCAPTIDELKHYRYKINRGGDILPIVVDAHNHVLDALRYALCKLIRGKGASAAQPAIARAMTPGRAAARRRR